MVSILARTARVVPTGIKVQSANMSGAGHSPLPRYDFSKIGSPVFSRSFSGVFVHTQNSVFLQSEAGLELYQCSHRDICPCDVNSRRINKNRQSTRTGDEFFWLAHVIFGVKICSDGTSRSSLIFAIGYLVVSMGLKRVLQHNN